ncbi:hypothetical protein FB45DRAFT_910994 [Roridomyces roridus]|uniref:F-box domain-containing protein n=1 Tax=Roridomyces roridus TaxID=1738132 RepID=A0AAD7C005_9AGAR|nr:hypothetical protein FB45DRAFT_910994 [Roridomyces roridus]
MDTYHSTSIGTPQMKWATQVACSTAQSASALTPGDLRALVIKLEARLVAQDDEIGVLQRLNGELWQEIRRLKGPQLPLEIFLLIVDAASEDKTALKTFSLVSPGWLSVARRHLFGKISLRGHDLVAASILSSPLCTLFPHVRTIDITAPSNYYDEGFDYFAIPGLSPPRVDTHRIDELLVHIPKFSALTTLGLYSMELADLDAVERALPASMKRRVRRLKIHSPEYISMRRIAAFVSTFEGLTTLECGEIFEYWREDVVAAFFVDDFAASMISPPATVRSLVLHAKGELESAVLEWFTQQHAGVIDSLVVQHSSSISGFKNFLTRFGPTLSNIELSFYEPEEAGLDTLFDKLQSLKSVSLTFGQFAFDQLAPSLFSRLPSSIEEITLNLMDVATHDQLRYRDRREAWSSVDSMLAQEQEEEKRFVALRRVSIFCAKGGGAMGMDSEEGARRRILRLLPKFAVAVGQEKEVQLVVGIV